MIIRTIKTDDISGVYNVFKITWIDTYPNDEYGIKKEDIVKRYSDISRKRKLKEQISKFGDKNQGWLCETDGEIIGICITTIQDNKCYLGALYILPNYQGKGIGKQLLNELFKCRNNYNEIYTDVAIYNLKSIKFYKKNGFKIIKGSEEKHIIINDIFIPTIKMIKTKKLL